MKRIIGGVLLVVLMLPAAHSQPSKNADLDRIRADIRRLRDRLEEVRQKTKSAEQELEEVDLELGIRTRELELALTAEHQLEDEQQALVAEIAALTPRIAKQKNELRKRLVALYRLGGLSYLRILLSVDDVRDPIAAVSMLSYVVSHDSRSIAQFEASQRQLADRHHALDDRRIRVREARFVVEERRRAMMAMHDEKSKLDARLRSVETGSARQLAELEEKAARLERLLGVLSKQPGFVPALDIRTVQGALGWPVQGTVVEPFGKQRNPKFSTVTNNNGLKIAADAGTQVRAVFQGTVLFSQWFKGYGNLIILDHGNRVFSLYGNLKAPAVIVGERVTTGQTIAGVGESEDAASGYLYFEVRRDNHPEDPQKWLR
ncbi:MAG TPA: peptidoglycan DD-metalloendopeptidase family protein [Thermoanaerobaculia bacterium]|nr:peptidoglycan DD-metalloendopeptidase family protein [Thermoanaerobaculia bacterium]